MFEEQTDSGEVSIEELAAQISNDSSPQHEVENEPQAAVQTPDDDKAERFARLAKRERELRLQKQKLKEQQSEVDRIHQLKATAKQNPKQLLETYGLSIDEILASAADIELPKEPEDPISILRKEIDELKAQRQKEKDDVEAAKVEAQKAQLTKFKDSIKTMVASDIDRYELIALHGQEDLIYDVIQEQYNTDGTVLTAQDAADKVEAYLLEESQKLLKAKKLQPKTQIKKDPTDIAHLYQEFEKMNQGSKPAPKTLSSKMMSMPAQKQATSKTYDEDDAFEQALKQLRFD